MRRELRTLKQSGITPEKHETYNDVKGIPIIVRMPVTNQIKSMTFGNFYARYLKDLPEKKKLHKDGTTFTQKEIAEKFARNASRVLVGNCNECRDVCEMIWAECTVDLRKELNLPDFSNNMLPYMEQVSYEIGGDHCFGIVNRCLSSDLSNIASWILGGRKVKIIDLWKCPDNPISVNEQLMLAKEDRNYAFEALRIKLEKGAKLEIESVRVLGEGHSLRWLNNGKDQHYFIQKCYPNIAFFKQRAVGDYNHSLHPQVRYQHRNDAPYLINTDRPQHRPSSAYYRRDEQDQYYRYHPYFR